MVWVKLGSISHHHHHHQQISLGLDGTWTSGKLRRLAGKRTMNQDVFPELKMGIFQPAMLIDPGGYSSKNPLVSRLTGILKTSTTKKYPLEHLQLFRFNMPKKGSR